MTTTTAFHHQQRNGKRQPQLTLPPLIVAVLLLPVSVVLAALKPLSVETRVLYSGHVFSGEVLDMEHTDYINPNVESGEWVTRYFRATVVVDTVYQTMRNRDHLNLQKRKKETERIAMRSRNRRKGIDEEAENKETQGEEEEESGDVGRGGLSRDEELHPGDVINVMMWKAARRPDYFTGDTGCDLIPSVLTTTTTRGGEEGEETAGEPHQKEEEGDVLRGRKKRRKNLYTFFTHYLDESEQQRQTYHHTFPHREGHAVHGRRSYNTLLPNGVVEGLSRDVEQHFVALKAKQEEEDAKHEEL